MTVAIFWFLGWKLVDWWRRSFSPPPTWQLPARPVHDCANWQFGVTRAGDGVARCWDCYRKEWRRAEFCGESWPTPSEAFT